MRLVAKSGSAFRTGLGATIEGHRRGRIARIVSGGQSGADRAALDVAIECGIPYGGWCPKGGWAEDFPDPPGVLKRYPNLWEAEDRDPPQRTMWNVRDSDATLIFLASRSSPGTAFTRICAQKLRKPHLVVGASDASISSIDRWLAWLSLGITLNVAGPRESEAPGIYLAITSILSSLSR